MFYIYQVRKEFPKMYVMSQQGEAASEKNQCQSVQKENILFFLKSSGSFLGKEGAMHMVLNSFPLI